MYKYLRAILACNVVTLHILMLLFWLLLLSNNAAADAVVILAAKYVSFASSQSSQVIEHQNIPARE